MVEASAAAPDSAHITTISVATVKIVGVMTAKGQPQGGCRRAYAGTFALSRHEHDQAALQMDARGRPGHDGL